MSAQLGTLDELPPKYLDQLTAQNAKPLWPNMRNILPYGRPDRQTRPHVWRYKELRP